MCFFFGFFDFFFFPLFSFLIIDFAFFVNSFYTAYSNNALCIRQLARDLIGPGRPGIDFVDALAMNWMANTTLMRGLHLGSKAATKRQRKSLIDSVVLKAEGK